MCFQMIEWGVAACAETGEAALAPEGLDMTVFSAFPIAHQSMDRFVGDAEVPTVRVGTGMPLGLDLFLAPTATLALPSGLGLSLDWLDGQLYT
jgi:hypothetical protein